MTALAADRATTELSPKIGYAPVKAATIIYGGSLVSKLDSTGIAQPAADTAATTLIGVAREVADNSAGAAGDINVELYRTGVFIFEATGLTQANVGADLFVVDDQTVSTSDPGNAVEAGTLDHFISATQAPVRLDI